MNFMILFTYLPAIFALWLWKILEFTLIIWVCTGQVVYESPLSSHAMMARHGCVSVDPPLTNHWLNPLHLCPLTRISWSHPACCSCPARWARQYQHYQGGGCVTFGSNILFNTLQHISFNNISILKLIVLFCSKVVNLINCSKK